MPLIPIASDARKGKPPCGECHIRPGETCNICGARHEAKTLEASMIATIVEAVQQSSEVHLVTSPSHALLDVIAERRRQVESEGWTPEHDDKHNRSQMAMAAALFAAPEPLHRVEVDSTRVVWSDPWPWRRMTWGGREQAGDPPCLRVNDGDGREKHDRRRRLVIAGALILAEIERLDRARGRREG